MGGGCLALANLLLSGIANARRAAGRVKKFWDRSFRMKTIVALAVLFGMGLFITGCNTVEGAGKDTKNAGQSIENAADRNK